MTPLENLAGNYVQRPNVLQIFAPTRLRIKFEGTGAEEVRVRLKKSAHRQLTLGDGIQDVEDRKTNVIAVANQVQVTFKAGDFGISDVGSVDEVGQVQDGDQRHDAPI